MSDYQEDRYYIEFLYDLFSKGESYTTAVRTYDGPRANSLMQSRDLYDKIMSDVGKYMSRSNA